MLGLAMCLSLGACLMGNSLQFRIYSAHATHIEVCLFAKSVGEAERTCLPLTHDVADDQWSLTLPLDQLRQYGLSSPVDQPIYYGYRVWGPNWEYSKDWNKGSDAGFHSDVDADGNRFNPNKILLDPYGLEVSHGVESIADPSALSSGAQRDIDSAPVAPKSVLAAFSAAPLTAAKPIRPMKDDVIYEVHVKGFTMNDPSVPSEWRGTYRGAAQKAAYLRDLGVTAVEFLPVQQMTSTFGNYWGYMTMSYFSPQRSYAFDQSPGGPTAEFRAMVDAFHDQGIKVYIDVVYNHTGEGGIVGDDPNVAQMLSFRGIDNSTYYNLSLEPRYYMDHTGCGNDLASNREPVRQLIMDSLTYWRNVMGVDGFRFDLAPLLGNDPQGISFNFVNNDPKSVLNRAARELPVRPATGGDGIDLIAEPWALGRGTYQQGNFPPFWAEWNGEVFRDGLRSFFNLRGVAPVRIGQVADAISGSASLLQGNGRRPWHSINFMTSHDGFTLIDLFSYDGKQNNQAAPWGPSDGGSDSNYSWDQGGNPAAQRQMARTALVTLLMSAGTPMLEGGDEFFRTLHGNNNPYNLDTIGNYLAWPDLMPPVSTLVRRLLHLRAAHESLRPIDFYTGQDRNSNGLKDVSWYSSQGVELDASDFNAYGSFIGYRVDSSESESGPVRSIYVGYNADFESVPLALPPTAKGYAWFRVADTAAWYEAQGNVDPEGQETWITDIYDMHERSAVVFLEMPISGKKAQ